METQTNGDKTSKKTAKKAVTKAAKRDNVSLLRGIKSMIRLDFGGKDAKTVMKALLQEKGVDADDKIVEAMVEIYGEQVAELRRRHSHRVDLVLKRLEQEARE